MLTGKIGRFFALLFIVFSLSTPLYAAGGPQNRFSNLIGDGSRLQKRTQEYAQHYGLRLISFELQEKQKKIHVNLFHSIPVVMMTEGDFQDVMVHLNRMALFAMSQKPLRLEIIPQPTGDVQLTTTINYYRLIQPELKTKNPLAQEEQWIRMQRAAKDLIKTQENGLLTLLMETLLDGLSHEKTKLVFQKFSWSQSKGGEIEFAKGNKKVYRKFRRSLKKQPYLQKVKWLSAQKSFPSPRITFELDRPKAENWRLASAYSPLGRVNPFHELGVPIFPSPLDPKEFCKKLTLEDLTLTQANPGFLGFGRGAEIRLPDHRSLRVDLGAVISRYQGTVIGIQEGQIIIEEQFLNAFKQLVTHQTVLTQKIDAFAVDL